MMKHGPGKMCLMRKENDRYRSGDMVSRHMAIYIDGASSDWVGRSMIGYYFSKDTKVIDMQTSRWIRR